MNIHDLSVRSRNIFQHLVENFLETGEPVGSRTLAKISGLDLSPASIRNVMADLEDSGLLYAPHTSAGRMPTEQGLRLFVDSMLEVGDLSKEERKSIEARTKAQNRRIEDILTDAISALSGLSHCACVVEVPKLAAPLKQIEFVRLSPGRGLAILVMEDGSVENRLINLPAGMSHSALVCAGNYLNARLTGRTLEEAIRLVEKELKSRNAELDELSRKVVEDGIALWSENRDGSGALIVRGRANLISDSASMEDVERIRKLFEDLEDKKGLLELLSLARAGDGVKIFIGAENKLFSLSGSSVVAAPYMNESGQVVGALGVIGPTRLNYARIIPMVDYTARIIGKLAK